MAIFKALNDYVVEMRRYFHAHPELSWQEVMTSEKIQAELTKLGIPFVKGKCTAVIGTIKGGQPGKKLGIRADIDALPVTEKTGLPFSSENKGVMHACGHDAHISILLAAAKFLNEQKAQLKGEIRVIFQSAE